MDPIIAIIVSLAIVAITGAGIAIIKMLTPNRRPDRIARRLHSGLDFLMKGR